MGEFRKPQFSKKKWSFFSKSSTVSRSAFCGLFVLLLWLVVITGIPPAQGASSLYLPLIVKLSQDDVPSPPAVPTPPPDNQFDNTFIFPKADGDLDQFQFGTPGKDKIEQYGGTGKTMQYAEGSEGDDWILQVGGDKLSDQTALLGDGNDTVYQYGGKGDTIQYAEAGTGNDKIIQVGGTGNNTMEAVGGSVSSTIEQYGGQGKNNMKVTGSSGEDTIKIYGGNNIDTLIYNVSSGTDVVQINGGPGIDTLVVNKRGNGFIIRDGTGVIKCQSGSGDSMITVVNVEHITVIGDDGLTPICQWP